MIDFNILSKVILSVLFFLQVLFFGLFPSKYQCPLDMFMALGAGLFISIALIHILPQSNQLIYDYIYDQTGNKQQYPFAFLIVLITFSIIYSANIIVGGKLHSHSNYENTENTENIENQQQLLNQQSSQNSEQLSATVLQIGIGLHAFFQGMGIGVQDHIGPCLGLGIAVAIHKWAQGMTLGIKLKKAKYSNSTFKLFILLQATINPIGIIVGGILSYSNDLVEGIITCISAGTFLYIGIVQMLPQSFQKKNRIPIKILLLNCGILIVGSLWYIQNAFQ